MKTDYLEGILKHGGVFSRKTGQSVLPHIEWKLFWKIFVLGYVVHSFRLTQMLNVQDDIHGLFQTYGAGTSSGRWGLSLIGDFINQKLLMGSFNIPVFNGVIALICYALSACIILELFKLQNNRAGMLFAGIFVVFPACAATLLYMYAAAYYGFCCLLSVLGVYFLQKHGKAYKVLAVICITLSVGIYQAYFPMAVTLCLFLVLEYFLRQDADIKVGIKMGLCYLSALCISLASYFGILKLFLNLKGLTLTTYQGLDSMGQLELRQIPGLIRKCYSIFLHLPFNAYHSVNTLPVTRICILVLFLFCGVYGAILLCRQKNWTIRIFIVLLALAIPVAAHLMEIMDNKGFIHELMIYSIVLIFLFPIIFLEKIKDLDNGLCKWIYKISGTVFTVVLVLLISGYSWHDNWNYVSLNYANKEAESYLTTLVTRIKSLENYKDDYPVLFAGGNEFVDEHYINPYSAYPEFYFHGNPKNLINAYTRQSALNAYTGFTFDIPSEEECEKIYSTRQFQEMSSYPDDGSIAIINGVIVVKVAD